MIQQAANPSAPGRLTVGLRLLLTVVAGTAALIAFAFSLGLVAAYLDKGIGAVRPLGLAVLVGALLVTCLLGFAAWRLSAYWRRPGRSAYQRRYARAWVAIIGAGMLVGLLFGFANDSSGGLSLLFSNEPLRPAAALGIAFSTAAALSASLVVYHRAIDDHELQAYLWANSLAFYFLVIAIPVAWLLARGGLIPAIGIGATMLILLGALVINLAAWPFLKFR